MTYCPVSNLLLCMFISLVWMVLLRNYNLNKFRDNALLLWSVLCTLRTHSTYVTKNLAQVVNSIKYQSYKRFRCRSQQIFSSTCSHVEIAQMHPTSRPSFVSWSFYFPFRTIFPLLTLFFSLSFRFNSVLPSPLSLLCPFIIPILIPLFLNPIPSPSIPFSQLWWSRFIGANHRSARTCLTVAHRNPNSIKEKNWEKPL